MTRREYDFYPTPTSITLDLLDWLEWEFWQHIIDYKPTVFEPCVGHGDMIKPIADRYEEQLTILTNDVRPMVYPGQYVADAVKSDIWEHIGEVDVTITNPPFNQALPIIENAFNHSRLAVFALLRLSWLEPTKGRSPFLQHNPPDYIRVYGSPRPSFTGKGTDSVTVAWMIWVMAEAYDITDIGSARSITVANNWKR